jgi:hypothetical protein
VQLLDGRTDVREATSEAIEGPDRDDVHVSATRVEHQAVERRPPVFRSAHTLVGVFPDHEPAARRGQCAKLVGLVIDVLVEGGHAEI